MDRFVSAQEGLPLKWASSFRQTNCSEGGGKFLKLAGVTGSATALSKVLGLVRELVLAAVFGVGPVVDAFGNQWTNPHSNGIGLKIPLSLGILMYTLAAFLIDAITTGISTGLEITAQKSFAKRPSVSIFEEESPSRQRIPGSRQKVATSHESPKVAALTYYWHTKSDLVIWTVG
ncbi:hypothetical protein SELMODRAFT_404580 [Selaginella moellendorffii]|uniref:Uncharacterized protein n=1 Tax=Selaginella moellendorffii TaxID=88036 RepID=D8QVS7_SELML|nr:hypothetical protein SELMODRAFT_404580 [Selaginella moellendorffii]